MNSFVLLVLSLFFLNYIYAKDEDVGFTEYPNKIEVPEPLFFDLVRGLSAPQGEWEINSLFYHAEGNLENLHWAPEFEWVFRKNMALEIELPLVGSTLKNYKAAFQATLHHDYDSASMHGIQLIYESDKDWAHSEGTALYIFAHRFNYEWSMISLLGVRGILEEFHGISWLLNQSFFYNYSRQMDVGLEINLASAELGNSLKQVVPQLHLTVGDHYKVQFGLGARDSQNKWTPIAVLRMIREFNK